jgi:hypothetical protein
MRRPGEGRGSYTPAGSVPRESIECQRRESRVTMMWSTTGMPSTLPAAISFAVVAMSSGLGFGSPEGWLCPFVGGSCSAAARGTEATRGG